MKVSTHSTSLLLPLLVPSVANAATLRYRNQSSIEWGPCGDDLPTEGLNVQCGKLTVPLDYNGNEAGSNRTIDLELIRHPAREQPAPKGSILLNFGGPGENGLVNFLSFHQVQQP